MIGHYGPVKVYLIAVDGSEVDASREVVEHMFNEGRLLWLDLYDPDNEDLAQMSAFLGIHPLATEDAEHFGQRPKIEDYDGFTQIVAYGVHSMTEPLVEVHFFYSQHYLVTVRTGTAPRSPWCARRSNGRRASTPTGSCSCTVSWAS